MTAPMATLVLASSATIVVLRCMVAELYIVESDWGEQEYFECWLTQKTCVVVWGDAPYLCILAPVLYFCTCDRWASKTRSGILAGIEIVSVLTLDACYQSTISLKTLLQKKNTVKKGLIRPSYHIDRVLLMQPRSTPNVWSTSCSDLKYSGDREHGWRLLLFFFFFFDNFAETPPLLISLSLKRLSYSQAYKRLGVKKSW